MTGQNTSSAVMAQRVEAHDSLDDFPTPVWATRALCEFLRGQGFQLENCNAREPTANRGYMVRPLREHFGLVEASDVHDYGAGFPVNDYLFGLLPEPVDFTIFNPPFRLAEQFIERAVATSTLGCAALVRTSFLEGEGRCGRIFTERPPAFVLVFSERVVMLRGRMVRAGEPDPANIDPKTDEPRKASTATSYAWLVWLDGEEDTRLQWITPCRRRFEREGDYTLT